MTRKELGKINRFELGYGGYQDAAFGVSVALEGDGWGVADFINGGWAAWVDPPTSGAWTEADRERSYIGLVRRIEQLIRDAKVSHIGELIGKPVEATFDGTKLDSWRILKEVL